MINISKWAVFVQWFIEKSICKKFLVDTKAIVTSKDEGLESDFPYLKRVNTSEEVIWLIVIRNNSKALFLNLWPC